MDKRFQVFVSSTFLDLQDERREVIQTLLELNCIPAGMELFPAVDDDAWTLIQHVIEQSDYYIVVVGGKYGSVDDEGISYTEREYDHAMKIGKPILAFLLDATIRITTDRVELDAELRGRLEGFRAKIEAARHCKYWRTADDLGGKVAKSLPVLFRQKPAVGWIRSDQASPDLLLQLQRARDTIEQLQADLSSAKSQVVPPQRISGESLKIECFINDYSVEPHPNDTKFVNVDPEEMLFEWGALFCLVGPRTESAVSENDLKDIIERSLTEILESTGREFGPRVRVYIRWKTFQKLKYQLVSFGVLTKVPSSHGSFWVLSEVGRERLIQVMIEQ